MNTAVVHYASSRLHDLESAHNNIIPPQVKGLVAQTKAIIDAEARKLPWLYLGVFALSMFVMLAIVIDFFMVFNLR